VLVVGGGISGVSLLRELTARRVRAVLLEAEHLAYGASGRNAGFLLAGTSENYAAAVARHGREVARHAWDFSVETHRSLAEALGGRVSYRRAGSITLAASPEEARQLEASADLLRDEGIAARFEEGALLKPEDGELDPAAAVAALAADCPAGSIFEGVALTALDDPPLRAERIVLCTNGYTSRLVPAVPIEPKRAQMVATAPDPRRIAERPTYSDFGYRYWRQLPSGEVLCGGWRNLAPEQEVGFEQTPTPRIQTAIEAGVRALGSAAPVTHRWAGTMGFTPDGLPLVGEVASRPGVYLCAGYTGHGMAFAFNCARALAAHLTGGAQPPKWMVTGRFSL
jgi:glycine/D-amino acid oxidase-like deaminating enzyme